MIYIPRRALALLVLAFVLATSTGCGYTLVGRGNNLPEDIRQVFIEPLVNGTPRTQVEQILTQAISDELVIRRRFDLVNNEADADAVLRGKVVGFRVKPITFDANGLADNFEIEIKADMKFERVPPPGEDEGEVIWANSRYSFRQDYPLQDSGLSDFDRETLAIEDTSERFAETLVTDLLEGF